MIRFILNNKEIKTDAHPGTSLLDFIRYSNLRGCFGHSLLNKGVTYSSFSLWLVFVNQLFMNFLNSCRMAIALVIYKQEANCLNDILSLFFVVEEFWM